MTWVSDAAALELLERAGPFESEAYRNSCVAVLGGAADASFGASADDGTIAAIALVRQGRTAHLPFGYSGVRASRRLDAEELWPFLRAARRACGAQRLIVHDALESASGGRVVAWTSFAYLDEPPVERFASKARQSMRRAVRAGATCKTTADPTVFAGLYGQASRAWGVTYPLDLIAAAAERGVARFIDINVDGRGVGSLAVLQGVTHWMYWLAAQNEVGRRAEVGYLGVAAMLEEARAAGAAFVNLGASAGLPGVAQFKKRVGGVERPVLEWRDSSAILRFADSSLAVIARQRRARRGSAS